MATLLYDLVHKPRFTNQLLALPSKEIPQVLEKIELLRVAPQPDAKNKKRLHQYDAPVFRIRAGNYRILYTFGDGYVTLLGVDNRDTVYDDALPDPRSNSVAPPPVDTERFLEPAEPSLFVWPRSTTDFEDLPKTDDASNATVAPTLEPTHLVRPPDDPLLAQLRISADYWPVLRTCITLDDLIAAPVPESVRTIVFDVCALSDYSQVMQEASYRAESAEDYRRFLDGDLVAFLLKLDPEQEKYVSWGIRGTGPGLLKGAPGTGKSIVAIYRAGALLASLRKTGIAHPRILFTTYTNSLVASSTQLLERLLGEDASLIEVRTTDSLVAAVLRAAGEPAASVDAGIARASVQTARAKLERGGERDQAFARAIGALSLDYLREELDQVIDGREHDELADYLADRRAGRKVPLTASQRAAVWRVNELRSQILERKRQRTFAQNHRRAAELVRTGRFSERYDGVIVDEAQDLSPAMLRMLVGLCGTTDRLLLTADPNQSIYGSHFRWADVHADLKFRGRTGVLRRNYRSTAEISLAARTYLAGAELDEQEEAEITLEHLRTGPRPSVGMIETANAELERLVAFLRDSTRTYRVGLGSCAVLVPTHTAAEGLARRLTESGLRAVYMPGKAIDLQMPAIKLVTMQSSKGLEFPIVALAGLRDLERMGVADKAADEERDEAIRRLRRVLYVAMTRAMQALLVLPPAGSTSPLFQGFDPSAWEMAPNPGPL